MLQRRTQGGQKVHHAGSVYFIVAILGASPSCERILRKFCCCSNRRCCCNCSCCCCNSQIVDVQTPGFSAPLQMHICLQRIFVRARLDGFSEGGRKLPIAKLRSGCLAAVRVKKSQSYGWDKVEVYFKFECVIVIVVVAVVVVVAAAVVAAAAAVVAAAVLCLGLEFLVLGTLFLPPHHHPWLRSIICIYSLSSLSLSPLSLSSLSSSSWHEHVLLVSLRERYFRKRRREEIMSESKLRSNKYWCCCCCCCCFCCCCCCCCCSL